MRTAALALALVASLVSACARVPQVERLASPARDDLYVVLPDRDGKAGAVTVTQGSEEKVLDQPYAAARMAPGGRLEVGQATEPEVRQAFGAALAAQPPRPVSFTLLFTTGADEPTPESAQVLAQVSAEFARRPGAEIIVIGHTDRVGSDQQNDALSLQRAERVRRELAGHGIPPDRMEIAGRGEREPLIPTADDVPEPRNRRVEITVR